MKELSPLFIVALICLSVPIFLPYMEYDVREFHGLFSLQPRRLIFSDQILHGSQTSLSYFPLIWILIPISLLLRKKSKANILAVLIFSILLALIMIVLFFALTAEPSFYKGYENVRLELGFWLSFLGTALLIAGAISMLRDAKPNQKHPREVNTDLLDDSI